MGRGEFIEKIWTDHYCIRDDKTGLAKVVGVRLEYEVYRRHDGTSATFLVHRNPHPSIDVPASVQQALIQKWYGHCSTVIPSVPARAAAS